MDKRTAELMLNLEERIDGLWRYLGHSDEARKAREKAAEWERHTEGLRRELSVVLIQSNAETTSYFRVVTAVAYAGYFATWSLVNSDLPQGARFTVALLGIISLGVFGLWEVFAAHRRLRSLEKMGAVLRDLIAPDVFEKTRIKHQAQEARFLSMMIPVWVLVMYVSIGSLVSGGAIMIYYFLKGIAS